jgi:hypothetical protein
MHGSLFVFAADHREEDNSKVWSKPMEDSNEYPVRLRETKVKLNELTSA